MKKIMLWLFIVLTTVVLSVLGLLAYAAWSIGHNAMTIESWSGADGEVCENLSYGPNQSNNYTLYWPAGLNGDAASLMLFIHGGAWMGGDKKDIEYACRRYAKQGYVTATMNYSLLSSDSPDVTVHTMTDEIDECIRAIQTYCKERGVTLRAMMLSGQSAGGHLAMLYSYTYDSVIPIAFIAIQVGPTDLDYLLGSAADADHEYLRDCSPLNHVTATSPPAILAYGAQDGLITLEHPRRLKERYDSLGLQYEYIEFPNSGHALGHAEDEECSKRYFEAIRQWADELL